MTTSDLAGMLAAFVLGGQNADEARLALADFLGEQGLEDASSLLRAGGWPLYLVGDSLRTRVFHTAAEHACFQEGVEIATKDDEGIFAVKKEAEDFLATLPDAEVDEGEDYDILHPRTAAARTWLEGNLNAEDNPYYDGETLALPNYRMEEVVAQMREGGLEIDAYDGFDADAEEAAILAGDGQHGPDCEDCGHAYGDHDEYGACQVGNCKCNGWTDCPEEDDEDEDEEE